jgi:hypothetical protein
MWAIKVTWKSIKTKQGRSGINRDTFQSSIPSKNQLDLGSASLGLVAKTQEALFDCERVETIVRRGRHDVREREKGIGMPRASKERKGLMLEGKDVPLANGEPRNECI